MGNSLVELLNGMFGKYFMTYSLKNVIHNIIILIKIYDNHICAIN